MPAAAVFAFVAGQTAPPAAFAVGHNCLGLGARVVTVFAFARFVAPGLVALGVQGVAALVFARKQVAHIAARGSAQKLAFGFSPSGSLFAPHLLRAPLQTLVSLPNQSDTNKREVAA